MSWLVKLSTGHASLEARVPKRGMACHTMPTASPKMSISSSPTMSKQGNIFCLSILVVGATVAIATPARAEGWVHPAGFLDVAT